MAGAPIAAVLLTPPLAMIPGGMRPRGDSDGPVVTVKGLRAPVRGLSFGSVAERYDRYRLGYPGELGTTVLRYARRPVLAALEVGAGTGKASRLFGSLGIEVTALEADADMARV